MNNQRTVWWCSAAVAVAAWIMAMPVWALSGAIYTTMSNDGVNVNFFTDKEEVYLNGGPQHPGAAGLNDGYYAVQVTEPDGTLLGTSIGSSNEMPVFVVGGEFEEVYQLWSILIKESNRTQGYDDSSNGGGVYKVWICSDGGFTNADTKTDNFKVKENADTNIVIVTTNTILDVVKFYDANANGLNDGELLLVGWKVSVSDDVYLVRYTPVLMIVEPGIYTVREFQPLECCWRPTTPSPVDVVLMPGDETVVEFGNLCLGPGGGKTLGFWSNKNGQALFGSGDLALMVSLNLRKANGDEFNPGGYSAFRSWLLSANAVNMAYMLSAQLAAMELNVYNGKVDGNALIYAPGVKSANALGYATVAKVMAEANVELGLHGYTPSGSQYRACQERIKNALDNANNDRTFVQPIPCPFTFADEP